MYVCAMALSLGAPGHWEFVFFASSGLPPTPNIKEQEHTKGIKSDKWQGIKYNYLKDLLMKNTLQKQYVWP